MGPWEGLIAMRSRRSLAVAALVALSLALTPLPARAQSVSPVPAEPLRVLQALEEAFAAVADRVTPSVVNVSVKPRRGPSAEPGEQTPSDEERRLREFFGSEFFDRFFRRRAPQEGRAAGSGVIVDARGYVLTNNHVVESAGEIEVRLSDDRKLRARLVGRDPKSDLAVLQLDPVPANLPVAALGDSDRLRTGQWAIAIGNPFGLDRTVTVGIISATGRTRVGVATYEAFIQTDASINPGNSGGPLLGLDGRVIGINTAIVATGQGIGFSIPINMAKDVMRQLIDRGRVVRGWLGIVIQDLTDDLAAGFGVMSGGGVLVADVMPEGPAAAAGVRPGDVVVDMAGAAVKEVTDLQRRVAAVVPGDRVAVGVIRDRQRQALTVTVGEQPGEEARVAVAPREEGFGLTVEAVSPETVERFGLSARAGVVVTEVAPGSAAAEAGIRPGDAVLEVNRRPVNGVEAFRSLMAAVKPGDVVPIQLRRGEGRSEYVVLKAPAGR